MSDKRIAAAMVGEKHDPGLFGLIDEATRGYWKRQGQFAQQGLDQAQQGAGQLRGGDPMGALNMLMGPAGYLASPINALFPERSEIDAAGDVPQWSKPLLAGGLEAMAIMAPGPKGSRLGKGLDQLGDASTDAERLALQARLEAEAAQTGGAANATTRDQALLKITEAAEVEKIRQRMRMHAETLDVPVRQYTPEEIAKLKARLAASRTPEDEAIATAKRYVPPIEDFIPHNRKPKN